MCREVLYEVEDGTVSFLTVFKDTWTRAEFMQMLHSIKPFENDDE